MFNIRINTIPVTEFSKRLRWDGESQTIEQSFYLGERFWLNVIVGIVTPIGAKEPSARINASLTHAHIGLITETEPRSVAADPAVDIRVSLAISDLSEKTVSWLNSNAGKEALRHAATKELERLDKERVEINQFLNKLDDSDSKQYLVAFRYGLPDGIPLTKLTDKVSDALNEVTGYSDLKENLNWFLMDSCYAPEISHTRIKEAFELLSGDLSSLHKLVELKTNLDEAKEDLKGAELAAPFIADKWGPQSIHVANYLLYLNHVEKCARKEETEFEDAKRKVLREVDFSKVNKRRG